MDPEEEAQDTDDSRTEAGSKSEYAQLLCAAWTSPGVQCTNPAHISCETCHLVAYCSEKCKAGDSTHNHASNILPSYPRSTEYEDGKIPDDPFFDTTTLWANYAAFDVLNLAYNEGPEYNGPLSLLLLGPFGLRHLIYSSVAIPETANPSLDATLFEFEMTHLVRTFISLLILSDEGADRFELAEAVVHVWYSAKWPEWVFHSVRERVGHILPDLYPKIQAYYEDGKVRTECYTATVGTPGYLTFDVILDWYTWDDLLHCCSQMYGLGSKARADDVSRCGEPLDRIFRTMSSSRTATLMKWRLDGLVVPYGESSSRYTRLNPAFVLPGTGLPVGITNEPLSEWPMDEILDYGPYPAKDDVYGKMNFYLREMIVKFRARLKKKGMLIKVITCGLVEMVGHIPKYQSATPHFDRIEVGNLFDLEPQLCFLACAPLLRHSYVNPFATMLTMSRESVTQVEEPDIRQLIEIEKDCLRHPAFEPLDSMTPRRQADGEQYSAALLPRHMLLIVYRDWRLFSYHYLCSVERFGFRVPGEENMPKPRAPVTATGYLGLHQKWENSVVDRYTSLPTRDKVEAPTKEEFMRWMSWPALRPQCVVEWTRARDVYAEEWLDYLEMIKGEEILVIWKRLYELKEEGKVKGERQGGAEAAGDGNKNAPENGNANEAAQENGNANQTAREDGNENKNAPENGNANQNAQEDGNANQTAREDGNANQNAQENGNDVVDGKDADGEKSGDAVCEDDTARGQ